jgi:signal transduction histidine kinase/HAMP domain-containing protein/FixJ family two-component response regulator
VPFPQKLAAVLIALVSLPVVLVMAYTTESGRASLLASARARDLERAAGTAEIIDAFLTEARADVRTTTGLATVVDLVESPDDEELRAMVFRSLAIVRDEQRFLAILVTDRAGRVLVATDARVAPDDYFTGRAFLSAVAGETAIADPEYEPFDRRVALRVSSPVRSSTGEISGSITALVDIAVLDALTQRDLNYAGHGEFGVLWTGAGVRLSDPANPALRFVPLAAWNADSAETARQRLGPAFPNREGEDGLAPLADRGAWLLYDRDTDPHLRVESAEFGALRASMVPLRGQRWLYAVMVPEARLLATLRGQNLRDWALAFFTVLAALMLSFVAARWVTQPLRRVTDVAMALAHGDMDRRVDLRQRDEFGQLADAFDSMADTLAEKERQLQAHAATLERRVAERTTSLRLLERASRTLAASLDRQQTAASMCDLLVPECVDYCQVDTYDAEGTLRRVAVKHVDAALDAVAHRLPAVRQSPGAAAAGEAPGDVSVALRAVERDAIRLTDTRIYPLAAGDQMNGLLTVGMSRPGRVFDAATESLCEELGRRAALAITNARLYHEAREANRLKDEFLGVVSHELRTPLNAIMGWARLAAMPREANIDSSKALAAVERNAGALARLVDDLLDVPRIMTGKLTLDLERVDLVGLASAAIDAIRPAADEKPVSLHFRADVPSAPLDADPQRLQQVFWNLLSNAVKFTPARGEVTLRLAVVRDEYVITVDDTGAGIPQEFLPFVFERFRQADSSTTRAHGGLGIGLSIARHLVDMHGGQITASSDGPGHGSRFTLRFPVIVSPAAAPEAASHGEASALRRLAGLRILVVDDDADSREVTAALLRSHGARLTTASSVREALDCIGRTPDGFDAVLADLGMPREDGYGFIAGVRGATDPRVRALPVVALTAYASRADRAKALAAGFNEHVAKPVTLGGLATALARVVPAARVEAASAVVADGSEQLH